MTSPQQTVPASVGPYPVRVVRNVRIPMADGTTLAADLYLPEIAAGGETGRFPAIIEYTPYHKTHNAAYGPRATRYPYFASHGYVFVNVDIRGTGDSEGFNLGPTSPEEVRDGIEVIRWSAAQPWCDGSVGMIGISYTAGVCYDAARQAPPELKAVVLCQMTSDWYEGMACPGGSPRPFTYENYAPLMAAYNFAPPDPNRVGPRWKEIWQARLDRSVPWGNAYLEHLADGPFWDERLLRGREAQVRAAVFLIGGWCDWYPDDLLRVFSRLRCAKRALIGPWTHNYPENAWPLPRIDDRLECLRWFDRHLKGIDADPARPLDSEPPVVLFVRQYTPPAALRREENGAFRAEPDWPPPHVETRSLYLTDDGGLTDSPRAGDGASELVYRPDVGIAAGRYAIGHMLPGWGMPDDQRLDAGLSLVYTGVPFDGEPPQLLGAPVARLWLACTAPVAFLSVKLCDVAPDGTSVLVTKGVLNLTHRDGHARPRPLEPGKVYEIALPLLTMAYRFAAGHRLRLTIASADFQNAWPTPYPHVLTILHGADHPSRIELPIAGPPRLPAPQFSPSEFPPLPPDQVPTPRYVVTRDLVQNSVATSICTQSGCGVNRSEFTVFVDRPAKAEVRSEFDYPLERPGVSLLVRARCVTSSDEAQFRHETEVNITLDGQPYWSKTWRTSAPRVDM